MSIYEIAKKTGYSPSTVARILRGQNCRNAKTREIILSAAQTIDYSPNLSARALRNNRTERLLFCIPDICNPFYFNMIKGVTDYLDNKNFHVMIHNTQHSLKRELKMIELLKQKYCDGMIMVSFNFCDENIKAIRESKTPVVLTNRYPEIRPDDNFDYVYVDHEKGMYLAAKHLIDKGCKNIILAIGDTVEQTGAERAAGFFRAMKEAGRAAAEESVIRADYDTESAYKSFKEYLESGKKADGIIAANDLIALGILRVAREKKIRIPDDLKLVSFDNTEYALNYDLTSIDMKQHEIGYFAAKLLLERIVESRSDSQTVNIDPGLIERGSSSLI